jgi:hypothetical protein
MRVAGTLFALLVSSGFGLGQTPDRPIPGPEQAGKGSDFLKDLTIESFGYSSAEVGEGFEFPFRLSDGPGTAYGLECPLCTIRPAGMERRRHSLPAFGFRAILSVFGGRAEFYLGYGGINAWRSDNTLILERRSSSFNDAWLVQTSGGARLAIDKQRHLWLGTAGRYLQNFGDGRKHWNTFGGSATFQFGH